MKGSFVAFIVTLLGMAVIGVTQIPVSASVDSTRDCDKYAVVYCGTMTPQEARNKYDQKDHAAIFKSMGISKSDLSGSFKNGIVYQDGRVVVNGKTVATGARMAARGLGGTQIPGTTAQKVSVSAMGSAQTAMVKFDNNGRFLFAIMKPCGNPVTATPTKPEPQPEASCLSLTQEKISDTRRRYVATTQVTNGAQVRSYTFTATKNGKQVDKKIVTSSKRSAGYTFTADGAGTYRVKVVIQTSEGNRTGTQCTKSFTVSEAPNPDQPGVAVEKYVSDSQKYQRVGLNEEFNYTILVKNTGDVDLEKVEVSDTPDEGISLTRVTKEFGEINDNTWTYTIPKLNAGQTISYELTAKVSKYMAGKLVNTVCVDAPTVPGSPDDCDTADVDVPPVPGNIEVCDLATNTIITINESDFDSKKHSKSINDCQTPEALPETGPVETFLQIIGGMSLVSSGAYYITSRRAV